MLDRLKKALGKARKLFTQARDAPLDEIEDILLRADVGVKYTKEILSRISRNKEYTDPVEALKQELQTLLSIEWTASNSEKPLIIMVSGVNGSGKTTTVAKLAYLYKQQGNVILASSDTYRDAASEQLSIWAERLDVEIVTSQRGQDAAAVVYDTISKAKAQAIDRVLVDTAGRMHTRDDLMAELKKIKRIISKFKPLGPDLNILTIDANLGQNSIRQARIFTEAIDINGLILTKFDGTSKGGAVIPICNELNLPVLFLGVGEEIDDIVAFDAHLFVEKLFEQ
jgi:fused signal recognition particle receptor